MPRTVMHPTRLPGTTPLMRATFAMALGTAVLAARPSSADSPPDVWALSSWTRALRSDAARPGKAVLLHAAGNEWESFQIAVRAKTAVRIRSVTLAPFADPESHAIPADHIRLYRAHQLHVTRATHRNTTFREDWYPDALIPFVHPATGKPLPSARFRAVPFDLPAAETHTFWIDVHVPDTAPAGEYRSLAVVTFEKAAERAVPVTLRVWPFRLPRRATLKTQFGASAPRIRSWAREHIRKGTRTELPDEEALHAQCAELTSRHRLNSYPPPRLTRVRPGTDGGFRLSPEQIAGWKAFLARYHVNAVTVPSPRRTFKDPVRDRERILRTLRSWDTALDDIGAADLLCYTYLIDEPNDPEAYAETRAWGRLIRASGSRVKVLVTEQTRPQKDAWGDLVGAVDIWVPLFSLFDAETAATRRAHGEAIWAYTALCQGTPTPWWHLDAPLLNYRVPTWIAWIHHMRGLLYWGGMAYWQAVDDPWTEPATYPRVSDGPRTRIYNGEGTLLYPARDVGYDGAVASMRLKALRDGIEDFEYLTMLRALGRGPQAEALVRSVTRDWTEWSRDPLLYAHLRRKLGCLIRDVMASRK